jgi:hypothetical protein
MPTKGSAAEITVRFTPDSVNAGEILHRLSKVLDPDGLHRPRACRYGLPGAARLGGIGL